MLGTGRIVGDIVGLAANLSDREERLQTLRRRTRKQETTGHERAGARA